MPEVLFPNLMFEEELGLTARSLPPKASRVVAELAPVMGLLADPSWPCDEDLSKKNIVVVSANAVPGTVPASLDHVIFKTLEELKRQDLDGYRFRPWGWSATAVKAASELNIPSESVDLQITKWINSRAFFASFDHCHALVDEQISKRERPGALCSELSQVTEALRAFSAVYGDSWVIKSNFSQAARNRLLGRGLSFDASQLNWLHKRFDASEPVYVEPWLQRLAECGLQFCVPPLTDHDQSIRFEGACEMLTDDAGRYRGSVLNNHGENPWWTSAISHCQTIAAQAAALGFHGPIGMDCMLFRHPSTGGEWLRPCHDINGRFTMGRVALSLQKWLKPDEMGFWCHTSLKSVDEGTILFDDLKLKNVRIVPTSPATIGTQPTNFQTVLLISHNCESLIQVARAILSQNIPGPFSGTGLPGEHRYHDPR